jgi:enoyl-CoA hydratase/carnithine racemase
VSATDATGVSGQPSPTVRGNVLYDVRDRVATVTLNRPEQRNPLSAAMMRDITGALDAAKADTGVRVVVLTGAGDKAFCAGADLGSFGADATELEKHAERFGFVEMFLTLERLGKPVIACVNGHALAGGFGLAMSCDLVVAADTATFGTPEINVGLWPMMIMAIISRNLPRKRAMELYLTGERLDAEQALQWGLVNRVAPHAEVRGAAHDLAVQLTRKSPLIVRLGRDAFYATESLDVETALRYLHTQLTLVTLSDDAKEGVTAFLEKREPDFKGR